MKIVCDSCQAKYSIADEKVQGKAFKIRCKKCNHIIVVKSGVAESAPAAAPAPAAEAQAAAAPVETQAAWHIVVEGEQVGPLSESDIKGRLSRSEISGDTLVWKEGFADWVKLSTVAEFADAAGSATNQEPSEQAAATPMPHSAPAQEPPVAAPIADLFAAAAPSPSSPQADIFAAASSAPAEMPAASPFAFGGATAEAHQSESANTGNGAAHLTGQRNENSVLFSLSNLEALAVPNQAGAVRPPSSSATAEGSGLIDIRSMAAMTVAGSGGADPRSSSAESLPTFSTPQFSALPPVLQSAPSSGPPKWLYPALGVVGLAVVGLGFGIYKVVSAPPPVVLAVAPPAAPAAPTIPSPPSAEKPPVVPIAPPPSAATGDDKPGTEKAGSSSEKADKTDKKVKSPKTGSSKPSSPSAKPAPSPSPTPTTKPEAPKPAEPSKPSKPSSIDDLLNQVSKKSDDDKPKKAAAPAAAALTSLSQSDIVKAMQAVQPKVKQCFDQYKVPGTALTNVSVAKGGRVAAVSVAGKFAGTPTGTCVEAAAKTAKFPPCEAMNFPWPFQLH